MCGLGGAETRPHKGRRVLPCPDVVNCQTRAIKMMTISKRRLQVCAALLKRGRREEQHNHHVGPNGAMPLVESVHAMHEPISVTGHRRAEEPACVAMPDAHRASETTANFLSLHQLLISEAPVTERMCCAGRRT